MIKCVMSVATRYGRDISTLERKKYFSIYGAKRGGLERSIFFSFFVSFLIRVCWFIFERDQGRGKRHDDSLSA